MTGDHTSLDLSLDFFNIVFMSKRLERYTIPAQAIGLEHQPTQLPSYLVTGVARLDCGVPGFQGPWLFSACEPGTNNGSDWRETCLKDGPDAPNAQRPSDEDRPRGPFRPCSNRTTEMTLQAKHHGMGFTMAVCEVRRLLAAKSFSLSRSPRWRRISLTVVRCAPCLWSLFIYLVNKILTL